MRRVQTALGFAAGVIFSVLVVLGIGLYLHYSKRPKPAVISEEPIGKLEISAEARSALATFSLGPADRNLPEMPEPPIPEVKWVQMHYGQQLPRNAIYAGDQMVYGGIAAATSGGKRPVYVCRAPHGNGVHPGKWDLGSCFIGYGSEIGKRNYEVAVYDGNGTWGRKSNRELEGALIGGWENNAYLYVCRIRFHDTIFPSLSGLDFGWHVGKRLANGHCHIGVNGDEKDETEFEYFYP